MAPPIDQPHPVFVLVGPDGGGKTTLAKTLASSYRVPVDHHGPMLDLDGPALCAVYLTSMVPAMCGVRPVVMDRGWPCEEAYGLAYRDVCRLADWQLDGLETAVYACGGLVVYCLPPKENCLAAHQTRKGEAYHVDTDALMKIYDRYVAMYRRRSSQAARYDYAAGQLDLPSGMSGVGLTDPARVADAIMAAVAQLRRDA